MRLFIGSKQLKRIWTLAYVKVDPGFEGLSDYCSV